ncbi:hypothetical protein J2T25_000134 [Citrobacter amalonaticus]|nr:hypothetical protein [Citrobacter amalonaticus]
MVCRLSRAGLSPEPYSLEIPQQGAFTS